MEELNCETVFDLPVLGGISESVVVTWIIMAVLVIASVILVRNLKVENPGKVQLALESAIGWAQDFFEGIIGKENRRYIPYLITVLLYLGISNAIMPLFGFKPPTKDLNVTAALAIMSMCLIEFSGIHKNGLKHWVKHFAKPVPVVAPIMVLEVVIRPLSLCMRLFGNMLAGFVVMELLKVFVPLIIPIPVSFYFDIFDGLLQAYVFVFLTALFMNEEME
ncbi:F0F1 ATP synthase subunit A [Mediterraneibacter sp. NSJ-55]|uniref:ATP synthase subunit a n=1 Tax=Mediterraneibacter hominis TaxID=2763054 RepID=A0A923LJ63_9FIRM|nr:F0F1 ATP synthase subunit A [Mediterraneibacter hominis]MBC5689681.1 F0F1 ATP synthase subunit A [Mediterraneibacter hominis]